MPSYRLELEIGRLRPGTAPPEVMDAAVGSCGHHVDATEVVVISGTARIRIRFSVPASSGTEEDAEARAAVVEMRRAVDRVADTGRQRLLRRRQGRWLPVLWL
ncbi:MAG TPA: hypothetical protein VHO26_11390 [Propionibacteriaceae bacterium]|nr:hypothetical protein [Propionibacteriaceae bacterium]